jgi:hypothetical protein
MTQRTNLTSAVIYALWAIAIALLFRMWLAQQATLVLGRPPDTDIANARTRLSAEPIVTRSECATETIIVDAAAFGALAREQQIALGHTAMLACGRNPRSATVGIKDADGALLMLFQAGRSTY